jgi:hypothetical protein
MILAEAAFGHECIHRVRFSGEERHKRGHGDMVDRERALGPEVGHGDGEANLRQHMRYL